MNKGQHDTFKKVSPDFFSIELLYTLYYSYIWYNIEWEVLDMYDTNLMCHHCFLIYDYRHQRYHYYGNALYDS